MDSWLFTESHSVCIVGWRLEGEIAARNVDGILLKLINNKVIVKPESKAPTQDQL